MTPITKSYNSEIFKIPILYVDDEEYNLETFNYLFEEKYKIYTAINAEEGLKVLKKKNIGLVITDERMPGMSGIEFLSKVVENWPDTVRIIISAYSDAERLLNAINRGHAQEYLLKPIAENEKAVEELEAKIVNALKMVHSRRLLKQKAKLTESFEEELKKDKLPSNIVGNNGGLKEIIQLATRFSKADASIHISGETGVGKEVFARFIHESSQRKDYPFISINCAALSDELLASELFGHERGAFTGAVKQRKGKFELAEKGTLFLDEIGDISPKLQVSLLRVLQENEFERVGGLRTIKTDIRILSATNRDLETAIDEGRFREDLYYRLNVLNLQLPPLKDRKEDIEPFLDYFIQKYKHKFTHTNIEVEPEVVNYLKEHDWPGNVRELENTVQRGLATSIDGTITLSDISFGPTRKTFRDKLQNTEEEQMKNALIKLNGNVSKAAESIGMARSTFRFKAMKAGLI